MSVVSSAAHFAALPDPRIARKRRHDLFDIVVLALCAVICGAEGWDDLHVPAHQSSHNQTTLNRPPNAL